ncbi:hypothetical protein DERF_014945 [Dermatophagoides farinae]|uniref:Uncharacterized protein n=1 Tax=Dermatophagoides farinae TaxID=6954 RepID=A0A922KVD7_DERFA|nr:hypothetical protein DERF_014945 [Dermatophagoides farinae]
MIEFFHQEKNKSIHTDIMLKPILKKNEDKKNLCNQSAVEMVVMNRQIVLVYNEKYRLVH